MATFDWNLHFRDAKGGGRRNAESKAKLKAMGKKRIIKRMLEVFYHHTYGDPILGFPRGGARKTTSETSFISNLSRRQTDSRLKHGKPLATPMLLRGFGWRLKVMMNRKVGKIPKGWVRLSKS